jgi:hypothetical protein
MVLIWTAFLLPFLVVVVVVVVDSSQFSQGKADEPTVLTVGFKGGTLTIFENFKNYDTRRNESMNSTSQWLLNKNCYLQPCGNMQFTLPLKSKQLLPVNGSTANTPFYPMLRHIQHVQQSKPKQISQSENIRIAVMSVWVSKKPLDNLRLLNHQQYCAKLGYDFYHLHIPLSAYQHHYKNLEYGWVSVDLALFLLQQRDFHFDYLFKLDMDAAFARDDLRLETLIDPFERYSVYATQIEESRFTQSHTWILRRNNVAERFLWKWWGYHTMRGCSHLAQEQGAFHFAIGEFLSNHHPNVNSFDCHLHCNSHRSTFAHHHCVLDWYEDNGFGMSGYFDDPAIYLYPFFLKDNVNEMEHFISPFDGFSLQIISSKTEVIMHKKSVLVFPPNSGWDNCEIVSTFQPLTIHPCKNTFYLDPTEGIKHIQDCF